MKHSVVNDMTFLICFRLSTILCLYDFILLFFYVNFSDGQISAIGEKARTENDELSLRRRYELRETPRQTVDGVGTQRVDGPDKRIVSII